MTLKKPFSMLQINPKSKSEVSINIQKLERETILNLEHSKAPNTIRAYQSDFNDFALFCSKMVLGQCQQIQKLFLYI